jgi:DNA-binding HxlR family transcriptional regulator
MRGRFAACALRHHGRQSEIWTVERLPIPRGGAMLSPMRQAYGQFCPVALSSEVLAERWTLLVVRELLAGARRFNDIRRGVPRLSATLLRDRLRTLEAAGVVERRVSGAPRGPHYRLTTAGEELRAVVGAIGQWGQRWARDIRPADLDPGWLVWAMHRRLDTGAMPPGRTVIEIEFSDAPARQRRFWLVHETGVVDVCLKDPGFEPTVRVVTRVRVMAEVWRGIRPIREEIRVGRLRVEGGSEVRRAFPGWLLLSVYAPIKRAR